MEAEGCVTGVAVDSGKPLLRAVFLRRLRLTRLLLEGGAYINESDGRGQTPLMVACRTQHVDAQSASRVKLVKYLLERGADPNIQDKAGRSALMHACREQAGSEVVSLLLASGADIGLEDQSGTSALVYAITVGDQKVLKLLLDTCKTQGKEVIIITTDKFPCGKLEAKHLNVFPLAPLDTTDKTALAAPSSPSEIQLIPSPQCAASVSRSPKQVFSFKKDQCSGSSGVSSQPCSPTRLRGPGQGGLDRLQQPLLRLNSEPWLKIPPSLLAQKPHAAPSSTDHLPDLGPNENLSLGSATSDWDAGKNARTAKSTLERWDCSDKQRAAANSTTDSVNLLERRAAEGEGKVECCELLGSKISLPGLFSSHSASHPNLHSQSLGASSITSSSPCGKNLCSPIHNVALSSLHCKLNADHYSSDPQLAVQASVLPEEHQHQRARGPTEGRRIVSSRSSTLLSSRETLEAHGLTRRVLSGFERRGSGASLLDHVSQFRPRCLPPLNINSPSAPTGGANNPGSSGRELCGSTGGLKTFLPSAPPGHPKELSRKMLLRRHSMQTEQLKTTA
ncbi:ankyrin repeat domain-containing protein 34B [Polymixia lowei]